MSNPRGALAGRTAIVTGGGRGIGRALSIEFATAGANLVVASRTLSSVATTVDLITSAGGSAIGIECDVGSSADVARTVEAAREEFGGIDILVNNAHGFGTASAPTGSPRFHPLEDFPEEEWDYTFQTGLKGTWYAMKAAFPYMREHGGRIINMGSNNGIAAMVGTAAYNASKEAIRALSRTAAAEWGKYAITVNVIVPAIRTEGVADNLNANPGLEERLMKHIPLRRFGDLEKDIGPTALLLAGPGGAFITGQTISVDGGMVLRP